MPRSEGERLMTICNACRYCEGYCAVFPAMERRTDFAAADLRYLANLCHNCAECYYACQYAPPHEFAVNVPKVLAEIRLQSYRHYMSPVWAAGAYERNGLVIGALSIIAVAGAALITARPASGDFYAVIPHAGMVATFGIAAGFVLLVWVIGLKHFWKESRGGVVFHPRDLGPALRDIFTLEYLRSGGAGCTYPNERHSMARRAFHHFTFYGFLLCFASTCVAAIYDNVLGRKAPYPYFSIPVILGAAGGAGLLIGPPGLLALKARGDSAIADTRQDGMDRTFVVLLLSSVTGLLLLFLRNTAWMALLLKVHLAVVLVLFVTLPYGKFVHGIYRSAALLRFAAESRWQRSRLH